MPSAAPPLSNSNVLSEVANISVGMNRPQEYASVFRRILALGVDLLIVTPLPIFYVFLLLTTPVPPTARGESLIMAVVIGLLLLLLGFAYFVYSEARSGQTLGKQLLHIRVVSQSGEALHTKRVLLRTIALIFDAILLCGLFFVLYSKKHQRIGDMLASTIVVKNFS